MRFQIMILLGVAIFFLTATDSNGQHKKQPVRQGCGKVSGTVRNSQDLVNKLCSQGAKTKFHGTISQPFFAVRGRQLVVGGQEVQLFEFKTNAGAQTAAKRISPDGSPIGTTMVTWVAPPHFFKSGRLIALYTGSDSNVISLLENALGRQFAGR